MLITGLTAERMQEIVDASIESGNINAQGHLILITHGGQMIDAGNAKGDIGNPGPQGIQGVPGGTTVQRDAYFGALATTEAQVALANSAPVWYNVTTGKFETYYVPSGTAGLAVPGLASGSAGWYTLSWLDKRPDGMLAITEITAPSNSSTGLQVIQSIPTFTFKANRWYEIEWLAAVVCSSGATATALAQLYTAPVADAANATTNLTEIMGYNTLFTASMQTVRINPKRKIKFTADTTLQIKATIAGNGATCYVNAGTTFPAQLSITDIGRQV